MECEACGLKNREGANFCAGCGKKLESRCSNCNKVTPATANFCDNCGFSLKKQQATGPVSKGSPDFSSPVPTSPPEDSSVLTNARATSGQIETGSFEPATAIRDAVPSDTSSRHHFDQEIDHAAERRQLTVVFCDLVGSTELSQKFDAEDMRQLFASYQAAVRKIVDRYAGLVARYIGDGILIYFGYPVAYEDSPQRALNAALEIVSSMPALAMNAGIPGIEMQVRIGINTGSVVVGNIGSGETIEHMAAVGDVPNIAARIQSCADPGEILIGSSTRRIVAEEFVFESLGDHTLKGISQPVELFRLLKAADEHSKIEASIRRFSGTVVGLSLIHI